MLICCDVTKNPVGTDTEMIGRPCQCQACAAARRIEELEGELRKWLEIYARSPDGLTVAVPVYQIERLTKPNL